MRNRGHWPPINSSLILSRSRYDHLGRNLELLSKILDRRKRLLSLLSEEKLNRLSRLRRLKNNYSSIEFYSTIYIYGTS